MTEPTSRLLRRIRRDFAPEDVPQVVHHLDSASDLIEGSCQGSERMQAALVLPARGDVDRLLGQLALMRQDWRDALMSGGLGPEGWPEVLDAELGPVGGPGAVRRLRGLLGRL